jgi:hypothetical protein
MTVADRPKFGSVMLSAKDKERILAASRAASDKARALLDDDIKVVMDEVKNVDELYPDMRGNEVYESLMSVIRSANARNESISEVKDRISALGDAAVETFDAVVKRIRG